MLTLVLLLLLPAVQVWAGLPLAYPGFEWVAYCSVKHSLKSVAQA